MTSIRRAYCLELDRVVTADEARREFLSLESPLPRFNFFCADERCRGERTRVTGVSYRNSPEEGPKYRTAHFRIWDEHIIGCPEERIENDQEDEVQTELSEEARQIKTRKKLTDFVDVFDPRIGNEISRTKSNNEAVIAAESVISVSNLYKERRSGETNDEPNLTRTNYLDKLVDTFLDARSKLTEEDFHILRIRVVNVGTFFLRDYFCPMARASLATRDRVVYGGAFLVKTYGEGFKLKFYDRVSGLPVYLYVAPHVMEKYRYKGYLKHIIAQAGEVKYYRVFGLGKLQKSPEGKAIDLIIDDLRHLAIVLVPKK